MNLISCENCGVVLDAKRLPFVTIDEAVNPEGGMDFTKCTWRSNRSNFVPTVPYPVCNHPVFEE